MLAAAFYFHRAMLLMAAGPGPSDFAGEAILNLAKVLEVLFDGGPSQSMDASRGGLRSIGYDNALIESAFIPCLVLRSKLDTAHVRLAVLTASERRKLHLFLDAVFNPFRDLIDVLIDMAEENKLPLPPYSAAERTDGDELATLIGGIEIPAASPPTEIHFSWQTGAK